MTDDKILSGEQLGIVVTLHLIEELSKRVEALEKWKSEQEETRPPFKQIGDEPVCPICGGRPSACRVLGHRTPVEWHIKWQKPRSAS